MASECKGNVHIATFHTLKPLISMSFLFRLCTLYHFQQFSRTGKSSWPELLRAHGYEAATEIEKENDLVRAIVVSEGSLVTQEFSCNRVWVWVDGSGKVTRVPKIGWRSLVISLYAWLCGKFARWSSCVPFFIFLGLLDWAIWLWLVGFHVGNLRY